MLRECVGAFVCRAIVSVRAILPAMTLPKLVTNADYVELERRYRFACDVVVRSSVENSEVQIQ